MKNKGRKPKAQSLTPDEIYRATGVRVDYRYEHAESWGIAIRVKVDADTFRYIKLLDPNSYIRAAAAKGEKNFKPFSGKWKRTVVGEVSKLDWAQVPLQKKDMGDTIDT